MSTLVKHINSAKNMFQHGMKTYVSVRWEMYGEDSRDEGKCTEVLSYLNSAWIWIRRKWRDVGVWRLGRQPLCEGQRQTSTPVCQRGQVYAAISQNNAERSSLDGLKFRCLLSGNASRPDIKLWSNHRHTWSGWSWVDLVHLEQYRHHLSLPRWWVQAWCPGEPLHWARSPIGQLDVISVLLVSVLEEACNVLRILQVPRVKSKSGERIFLTMVLKFGIVSHLMFVVPVPSVYLRANSKPTYFFINWLIVKRTDRS